jgi:hypothetical protein
MSKKYKGKLCVYCQDNPSINQGDHVFARGLFLEKERHNPIKVPACVECNTDKSFIEHYLVSLLPFGGRHSYAEKTLKSLVPTRLEKNLKLKRELNEGMKYVWSNNEPGISTRNLIIPFDGIRYAELFKYIVKALSWHHWGSYIKSESDILSVSLTKTGEEAFEKFLFSLQSNHKIEEIIGNNTVKYKGMQAVEDNQISIWKFQIYNGVVVSNSEHEGFDKSSCIGVLTGPSKILNSYKELFDK